MSNNLLPVQEKSPLIQGIVTIANYIVKDDGLDRFLAHASDLKRREFFNHLQALGPMVSERMYRNKIQNEGLQVLSRLLAGDTTYTGAINYGCLGTGTNAVTAADGQLQTEVYRTLYATRQQSSQSVTVDFYYSKSSTNGTYQEFGVCIDGTGSADSGQFMNRVLTGGWVKSSSVGMTVSLQIDLTPA